MNTANAIVIGLDCFTGVQSARILARRGVPVIGIAGDLSYCCAKTNACARKIESEIASPALIDALEKLGPDLPEKGVLFPCTDTSVSLISAHRSRLATWYHIMLPAHETVQLLMDKMAFLHFAQQQGLPVPQAYFLRTRADALEAAEQLHYPCILKPPFKTPRWEAQAQEKVFKVSDARELLVLYDLHADLAEILMAQEWVPGTDADLYSCNVYFDAEAQPLVTFVARKLRQWPPEAGTSCLGEECRNQVVLDTTVELFRRVRFHGLGYVEMKRDRRTGQHYIIEPNIGRPTGRSAIAEAGGVELLYTMYRHATGAPLPENRVQRYRGVKWIYLRRDLQSALYYRKKGELTLAAWLKSLRGRKAYALFSWRDPRPFFADILRVLKLALRRLPRSAATPVSREAKAAAIK